MKMRRILALLLGMGLLLGTAAPASAQQAADQELMTVTAKVKAALKLDTEPFTDFQGWSDEDLLLGKRWYLSWSGDGISLSITADADGKVYSYYYSRSASDGPQPVFDTVMGGGRFSIPTLPEDTSQLCLAAARDFLALVLTPGLETVELADETTPSLYQTSYRFSSTILLNGVPSPASCSLTVAADGTVTRFSRSDQRSAYLGGIPGADTSVTEAQAQRLLRNPLEFDLYYVLGDDHRATLQYVPQSIHDYYVDGVTGELVDLTQLRELMGQNSAGDLLVSNKFLTDAAVPEASLTTSLTQAELEGAAILAGAWSKEELDAAIRNLWPEIGLDRYTLAGASFTVSEKPLPEGVERTPEDYDVSCRLNYTQKLSDAEGTARKYVTVDAKTGVLLSLSSYRPYVEDVTRLNVSTKAASEPAAANLRQFIGDVFDALALYETRDGKELKSAQHFFVYDQFAYGYFYHGNRYTVGVDAVDGTLSHLSGSFDETVEVIRPERVVSRETVRDAYAQAMVKEYRYLEVPVSVETADYSLQKKLTAAGYRYVNALKTGYILSQPQDYIYGVDAVTGEVLQREAYVPQEDRISYDDLEGHWVRAEAEALAVYNIGLPGGSLRPGDALTQLDMLVLLTGVDGSPFDPAKATGKELDAFYDRCYWLGLVTPETRDPDREITRSELVKLLLDISGYSRIAALPDIFRCGFTDEIPPEELGYAALAQALGLVRGDSRGAYAGGRTVTRAEAVAMLHRCMTR